MFTSALLTILALFTHTTKAALTDCSAASDTCICVWNLVIKGRRMNNGLYRIVNDTKDGTQRDWKMDDMNQWTKCGAPTNYKMFWYYDGNGRWFLGDSNKKNTGTGNCFCSSGPGRLDPTQDSCNLGDYICDSTEFPPVRYYDDTTPGLIDVDFGECQVLKDYCTTIKVTADAPYDLCNGIYYNYDHQFNNLDNEINIYRNQDDTAINRYVYFDQTQFRWVCGEVYDPCSLDFSTITDGKRNNSYVGDILYWGAANDPGTPDFTTIRNTGQTWSVPNWGHLSDMNGVATFECNPPTPTVAPTTAQPTSITTSPTPAPTTNPTPAPTGNPNQEPTKSPTPAPTSQPTPAPTSNPTPSPTTMPTPSPTTNPTQSPTNNPTPAPTGNPLAADETSEPTKSPITLQPTMTPTTKEPSSSPTNKPTDITAMPTRSPLEDGKTHAPTSGTPTKSPITPRPTDLTFGPTGSPLTKTPTKSPTAYSRTPEETRADKAIIHWTCIAALVSFIVYLLFI